MTDVPIENLGTEMGKVLTDLAKKNERLVAEEIQQLPFDFLLEAQAFYPTVLNVISGRLLQSFETILRITGNAVTVGLRSRVRYARIQHDGGRTPPHEIKPRFKKALSWPGAAHPVGKVNHPGSSIKATKFFAAPMLLHVTKFIGNLRKKIGF